jgi:hypothetical protein
MKQNILLIITLFALMSSLTLQAQVTIGKNQTPDPAAVLDLQSNNNLGLLLPRIILTDTLVAAPLAAHVQGMFVYNTAPSTDEKVIEGIYYNDGRRWWLINAGDEGSWQVSGTTDVATANDQNIYQMGQVAIGSSVAADPIVMLNIVANDKGIMIPRMSEAERNAIDVSNHANANSLLIYNTDEDCYNYFSRLEQEWQSLCGKLGKAVFDIADCSSIQVSGQYLTGSALGTAHQIKMRVDVTKAGSYSITAMTAPDNGYYFSTSGEFLTTGTYEVILQGAGTPRNFTLIGETGDLIEFDLNGIASSCNNTFIKVEDSSIHPIYSMVCNTVQVNGVYVVNRPLDQSNTITLQLNVDPAAQGATYFIETNTIDGIRFAGSGILMGGLQTVTLHGSGRPTSYVIKHFTITNNSVSDVESCFADITIAYSRKRILSIGTYANSSYGYNFSGTNTLSNALVTTPTNFGLLENSAVKVDGIEFIRTGDFSPTLTALQSALAEKPDIVILGVWWNPNAAQAQALVDYVAQGGVLLAFMEEAGTTRVLQSIFGQTEVSARDGSIAGSVYQLPFVNDEVLNGPFGDIRGMQWGEDASTTRAIQNIPASQVTIYSYANCISGTPISGSADWVTAFRHNTLNLIFVCDGGFNSGLSGNTSTTICPFALDSNNRPTFKPGYGRGTNKYDVYNAVFTANALAWAMRQAQFNGINK